jgi:anti-sigma-K factor RskA
MSTLNEHDIDRIQDYIDGELPDDEMRAVADRLNREPEWRAEEERLRALIRRAQALPKEIDPGRDLWRGIERRIAETPANMVTFSRRTLYLAGAAAAAVAVVAALSFVAMNQNQPAEPTQPRIAEGSGQPDANVQFASYEDAQYELAIPQYKSATDALHQSLNERRDSMEEETWVAVSESLAVIHQAIADIEAALEDDPENTDLRSMLVAAYEKEVGLLRQAVLL